jgi:hypothetical protein
MQAASRKTLKGWLVLTGRIQNCQSIVGSLHLLMTCVFDMCACNHQEVLKRYKHFSQWNILGLYLDLPLVSIRSSGTYCGIVLWPNVWPSQMQTRSPKPISNRKARLSSNPSPTGAYSQTIKIRATSWPNGSLMWNYRSCWLDLQVDTLDWLPYKTRHIKGSWRKNICSLSLLLEWAAVWSSPFQ